MLENTRMVEQSVEQFSQFHSFIFMKMRHDITAINLIILSKASKILITAI